MRAGSGAATLRAWLRVVVRWPLPCVVAVLALTAGALYLTATRLGFSTDTADLVDPDLPFRQAFSRYAEQFPQYQDTLVAVVRAPAPEYARATAERLERALEAQGSMFPLVYRPRGSDFLERHALLYLEPDRLAQLGDRLAGAQPLLARMARDTSITGYFELLRDIAEREDSPASELDAVFTATAAALGGGSEAVVSWSRLMRGDDPIAADEARALVVTTPRLDYERVMAGREAMQRLDAAIAGLEPEHPATTVRVTGKVALQFEELQSALGGAQRAGVAALAFVAVVLYFALRSVRLLAAALATLIVGMSLSAGVATLAVGHLNLISIAFAVLYVGLGINYAVHYLIRFREALAAGHARHESTVLAGERLGGALTLCTVTTAIGFFAFLPTDFAGVAELGLIAGLSMFVTLGVTYTLLPALLALLPAPKRTEFRAGLPLPDAWLDWPSRHRNVVRVVALLVTLAAIALASQVRFDEDPLNLRDPESESVIAARALLADGGEARQELVVLAEGRERLQQLGRRLAELPGVERTVDLFDLVPADQAEKLQQIRDLEFLLGPAVTTGSFALAESPSAADALAAARDLRRTLDETAGENPARQRLAQALDDWLAAPDPAADVQPLQQRLLGTLPLAIARLQKTLTGADEFRLEDLPASLRARYRSESGIYLLQVLPAGDMSDPAATRRFVESVRSIAPQTTGVPVLQLASGEAVVTAFRTALASAVAGITLVLLILLREVVTTVRVLVPLVLGGVLTVAAMVLLGIPFNFANVIALPLLFGVGVDNGIHMVSRQHEIRSGLTRALHTSTARAILFGALATVVSFGNLALSPHDGTASMGIVLALGMILIVATTFLVLPALFGRPREPA